MYAEIMLTIFASCLCIFYYFLPCNSLKKKGKENFLVIVHVIIYVKYVNNIFKLISKVISETNWSTVWLNNHIVWHFPYSVSKQPEGGRR